MTLEMIFKKIGLMLVYYFMIGIVDTMASSIFSSNTMGFFTGVTVAAVATYALRKAYVHNLNTLQEKRDEYMALSIIDKIKKVLRSPHFGIETILCVLTTIVFMLIPRASMGMSYYFALYYVTAAHRLLFIPLAIGFVVLDIALWILAYRKVYMRKMY